AAHELAPPRVRALRRTASFVAVLVLVTTVFSSFLFTSLVPREQADVWAATPLSGLAQYLQLPAWANGLMTVLILAAALAILVPAAHAGLEDTEQLLRLWSAKRVLPPQFGRADSAGRTPANSTYIAAAAAVLVTFASGAQVGWLSRAYGLSIAVALLFKIGCI